MSMMLLTILQIIWVSLAYASITWLFPWLLLCRKLAHWRQPAQFFAYFMAGNFFFIYLVYLLQILHISNRITLLIGTFAPFGFLALKYKEQLLHFFERGTNYIVSFTEGEIGIKTIGLRFGTKIQHTSSGWLSKWLAPRFLDVALMISIIILTLVMYGTNTINVYGYKASDMILHNYWINGMEFNQIFIEGVYPFGFHCLLYYLHVIFYIPIYILLRVFGFIQVGIIHLVLFLFLRLICKSKYTPYIGILAYLTSEVFHQSYVYYRYFATLPQEYGMIFILPTTYFVISFLKSHKGALILKKKKQKDINYFLLFFGLGVSLTLTIHFYATVVVGLMCLGIAVGFWKTCFSWPYLKKLLLAGSLGLSIGAFPMLVAYQLGTPLNSSFYWGMNVVSGIAEDSHNPVIEESPPFPQKEAPSSLEDGWERIIWGIEVNVTNQDRDVAIFMLSSILLLLILGLACYFIGHFYYGKILISFSVFMTMLCICEGANYLKIPSLIEEIRCAIYIAYGLAVVWSLCFDAIGLLLFQRNSIRDRLGLIELMVVGIILILTGIRTPIDLIAYESNEAILCLTNILRENENNTVSWTICSPNDERQMIGDRGYHYETITFLRDQENISQETVLTIPTDVVYFFIEKTPLNYYEFMTKIQPDRKVSSEGASLPLSKEEGIKPYQEEARWITMSHMYYWAEAFQKLYPNEMEVYYQTDDFICYRVYQDKYNLYNFAIDYGYNS